MTSDKLASFSLGGTKKTAFQKHKEAKEAKRKAEEEAAQAEYAQWVEEFEGGDKPKAFVRGGVMGGGAGGGSSGGGGRHPSASARAMFSQPPDEDIDGAAIDGAPLGGMGAPATIAPPAPFRRPGAEPPAPPPQRKKESKPSQIASFMEELRREHAEREARGERGDGDGGRRGGGGRGERGGGERGVGAPPLRRRDLRGVRRA